MLEYFHRQKSWRTVNRKVMTLRWKFKQLRSRVVPGWNCLVRSFFCIRVTPRTRFIDRAGGWKPVVCVFLYAAIVKLHLYGPPSPLWRFQSAFLLMCRILLFWLNTFFCGVWDVARPLWLLLLLGLFPLEHSLLFVSIRTNFEARRGGSQLDNLIPPLLPVWRLYHRRWRLYNGCATLSFRGFPNQKWFLGCLSIRIVPNPCCSAVDL